MGNAAAKELDETKLGVGTIDDGKAIAKAFVTGDDGSTMIKNKGKTWVKFTDDEETPLWSYKHKGLFRKQTIVMDSEEKVVAIIFTGKKTMFACDTYIVRKIPAFDGQPPLTAEELEGGNLKEIAGDEPLYKFAKIESSSKLSTASCTYSLYGEGDALTALYTGEKLASLGFRAIFKDTDGTAIAKASVPGMALSPQVEAASKVDMLAVVSMGYQLTGDESAAGALAGAGVV